MKFRMESFDEILLEAIMETMRFPSTMVMKKNIIERWRNQFRSDILLLKKNVINVKNLHLQVEV